MANRGVSLLSGLPLNDDWSPAGATEHENKQTSQQHWLALEVEVMLGPPGLTKAVAVATAEGGCHQLP